MIDSSKEESIIMRKLTARVRDDWKPKEFIIEPTNERLIPSAGMEAVLNYFDQSYISRFFLKSLPERNSNASCGRKTYGYLFLYNFLEGNDSIEDMEEFAEDYFALEYFQGDIPCPKAC